MRESSGATNGWAAAVSQHGCRRIRSAFVAALAMVLGLAATGTEPAQAQDVRLIAFYDPDSNHQAILNITRWFDGFLAAQNTGLRFQPVQSRAAFDQLLRDPRTVFAIAPATLAGQLTPKITPLLVPSEGGSVYYRKRLVANKNTPMSSLAGKSIAATVSFANPSEGTSDVLALLNRSGINASGASVIPVTKDIDALLALAFGQVQAALVTPSSVDVLRRINPGAVENFVTIKETRKILRSPLGVVGDRATADEVEQVLEVLKRMGEDENGRNAMRTLGFDSWTKFSAGMLEVS